MCSGSGSRDCWVVGLLGSQFYEVLFDGVLRFLFSQVLVFLFHEILGFLGPEDSVSWYQ